MDPCIESGAAHNIRVKFDPLKYFLGKDQKYFITIDRIHVYLRHLLTIERGISMTHKVLISRITSTFNVSQGNRLARAVETLKKIKVRQFNYLITALASTSSSSNYLLNIFKVNSTNNSPNQYLISVTDKGYPHSL